MICMIEEIFLVFFTVLFFINNVAFLMLFDQCKNQRINLLQMIHEFLTVQLYIPSSEITLVKYSRSQNILAYTSRLFMTYWLDR